jgi:hypothetical protein
MGTNQTKPTVTKLAEDRAEQLKRDPDKVTEELDERLRADLRKTGDFSRIHPMPRSGADVPDDLDARLVVLPAEHPYTKEPGNAAEMAARAILETRGNTPRLYRNTLVFLAADKVRLQDLHEAVRRFLAWKSILAEKETLNLDPHQVRQAETQKQTADGAVTARVPETYQWLLVPEQADSTSATRTPAACPKIRAPLPIASGRITRVSRISAGPNSIARFHAVRTPALGPYNGPCSFSFLRSEYNSCVMIVP